MLAEIAAANAAFSIIKKAVENGNDETREQALALLYWAKGKLHAKQTPTARKPMVALDKKVNLRSNKGLHRFTL